MTRYLCTDVSHARDGEARPVDLTAQVRLERELLPRPLVYLAFTERVLSSVAELPHVLADDRRLAVRSMLAGTAAPLDIPVILASERGVLFHTPGLHEMDDLRRTEPAIERLFDERTGAGSGDFLRLRQDATAVTDDPGDGTRTMVEARITERGAVTPQGVFDPWDLSDRLATADPSPEVLTNIVRTAPRVDASSALAPAPWRVVVTCPVPEGDPPVHHDVAFTGTGGMEAGVVEGLRAGGVDVLLEEAAASDLAPGPDLARAERRLTWLLGTGLVASLALLVMGWLSGGLAMATREAPGWLAIGAGLVLGAFAFAAVALLAPRDPRGNVNDTFAVRRFYSSRAEMLQIASAVALAAWLLGVAVVTLAPMLAAGPEVPAASVRFEQQGDEVVAEVTVTVQGLATGDIVTMGLTEFETATSPGDGVGVATATGSASGTVQLTESVALAADAGYLAVTVSTGEDVITCDPSSAGGPGCTVVALPGSLEAGRRPLVVSGFPTTVTVIDTDTGSSVTPSPSPLPEPSPTVTPSPTG